MSFKVLNLNLKILVVDDVELFRLAMVDNLKTIGFRNFLTAENGKKALTLLQDEAAIQEPVELILSDIKMPEMDGINLLRQVRAHPVKSISKVPFIITSAVTEQGEVLDAIKYGVNDYIIKPVSADVLKLKLATFFNLWQKMVS